MDQLEKLRLRREREINRYLAKPEDAEDERLDFLLKIALLEREIIDIKIALINTTNDEERRHKEQQIETKEQLLLRLLPPQQMVVAQPGN
jgi:hypothetical protein